MRRCQIPARQRPRNVQRLPHRPSPRPADPRHEPNHAPPAASPCDGYAGDPAKNPGGASQPGACADPLMPPHSRKRRLQSTHGPKRVRCHVDKHVDSLLPSSPCCRLPGTGSRRWAWKWGRGSFPSVEGILKPLPSHWHWHLWQYRSQDPSKLMCGLGFSSALGREWAYEPQAPRISPGSLAKARDQTCGTILHTFLACVIEAQIPSGRGVQEVARAPLSRAPLWTCLVRGRRTAMYQKLRVHLSDKAVGLVLPHQPERDAPAPHCASVLDLSALEQTRPAKQPRPALKQPRCVQHGQE
jgi:hypothetical protein